jgi:hypothetical protein
VVCERDLEGIVGKWRHGRYQTDGRRTSWVKIKNPDYTQMRDRTSCLPRTEPTADAAAPQRGRTSYWPDPLAPGPASRPAVTPTPDHSHPPGDQSDHTPALVGPGWGPKDVPQLEFVSPVRAAMPSARLQD